MHVATLSEAAGKRARRPLAASTSATRRGSLHAHARRARLDRLKAGAEVQHAVMRSPGRLDAALA